MAPFVDRARPLEPRCDARRRLQLRALAVPRADGQLRLVGHRHGARRHLRQGRRPAALAPARRRAAQRRHVLLLPLARRRRRVCARRSPSELAAGYEVFYLKVGLDDREDVRMVATLRDALGDGPRLRIDVNSNWSVPQALRMLERLARVRHRLRRAARARDAARPARRAARGARRSRSAPTRASGRRPTRTRASARARPTSTASRPRGSARWRAFSRLAHVAELEGLQDLQAHPRRARHHGRRLPARAADAAEHRRRAPADGADDGARRAHARRCRSRTRRALGHASTGPGSASRSTPAAVAEAAGPLPQRGPVPALAARTCSDARTGA